MQEWSFLKSKTDPRLCLFFLWKPFKGLSIKVEVPKGLPEPGRCSTLTVHSSFLSPLRLAPAAAFKLPLLLPNLGPSYLLFPLPKTISFLPLPLIPAKLVFVAVLFLIPLRASLKIHLLWEVATSPKTVSPLEAPHHLTTHALSPFLRSSCYATDHPKDMLPSFALFSPASTIRKKDPLDICVPLFPSEFPVSRKVLGSKPCSVDFVFCFLINEKTLENPMHWLIPQKPKGLSQRGKGTHFTSPVPQGSC